MAHSPADGPCLAVVLGGFHVWRYSTGRYGQAKSRSTAISPDSRPHADGPGARGAPRFSRRFAHRADLWPLDPSRSPVLRRQDASEPARDPGGGALARPPGHRGPGGGLHPAAGPERPGVALPGCPAPAPGASPCPRLIGIRPVQHTREQDGQCQGHGVWWAAPVNTGEPACVNVSDDEAHRGVKFTQRTASAWWAWQAGTRRIAPQHGGVESPALPHWPCLLMGLTGIMLPNTNSKRRSSCILTPGP
jgi:hypothetical protein